MNRVIKFRGKSINNIGVVGRLDYVVKIGDMVYGDLRTHDECCIDTGEHIVKVNPDTVGQFTGLYDKNGKEIYEGDIISLNPRNSKTLKVYWNDRMCNFLLVNDDTVIDMYKDDENHYKVIGNIHENPELLKEGGKK